MITVSYDKEIDAKYITIKIGNVHDTRRINDWLFVDTDTDGNVLGIEVLDSSKKVLSVSTLIGELQNLAFFDGPEEYYPIDSNGNEEEFTVASTSVVSA